MRSKRPTRRFLAPLLCAAGVSLALVAGAEAVIYVYSNGFKARADVREVTRKGGGAKCDKSFRRNGESLGVTALGRRLCEYSPPVAGDASQPNHVLMAKGRVLKSTPKALRDDAYLAVKVRAGQGRGYELQVRPKAGRFKLLRSPSGGGVDESGKSNAINKIGKLNTLRLEVKNARVKAFVNGKKVAGAVDSNPEQIDGRKLTFGLGSRKDGHRAVVGSFDRIRAGLAN
jgi:Domain of Unknown Function (DUF1080)